MNRKFYSENLWKWKCGIRETKLNTEQVSLEELKQTEWSKEFESLMRNRLIMGALRYGRLNEKGKPKYNRIADVIKRLKEYEEDGNLEHLVDGANILMCEFEEGDHPKRHFKSQDDRSHTEVK